MLEVLTQVKEIARRVYTDRKAIFIYPGPKIGLAIVICVLKS